ncbi:hypothetical protein [Elstera litoralis]|uniref:hypothetical protein n=1 Tax=Elstera litoralis TaxID=552518 RepID=UPI000AAB7741
MSLTATEILPEDADRALLIGRVWSLAEAGPCPVLVRGGRLLDVSALAPTVSGLLDLPDLAAVLRDGVDFPDLGSLDDYLAGTAGQLLAPVDLQAVKAAGVTFADSMLERVIEEQAKGDPTRAQEIRIRLAPILGDNLRGLVAGSDRAAAVKAALQDLGLWSQYLEVGIGPDAEIFTKAQPMAAVGCGARWAFTRFPTGTTRSRKLCWFSRPVGRSSARPWGMTLICAMSKAVRRCCSAKPRIITPPARWGRSFACSTGLFRWRR